VKKIGRWSNWPLPRKIPSGISYGKLRLHPYYDPLRGDPRFDKIVTSLAPK
jgi:hypothetical protein